MNTFVSLQKKQRMSFKNIDINTWERKEIFEFYKDYEQPFFNITANIDVTNLYKYSKKNNYSFFLSCLFISTKVANSIDAFKIRLENNKPIIFDKINTGSTILKDNNTFFFMYLDFINDVKTFIYESEKQIEIKKQTGIVEGGKGDQAIIYHSTLPWIRFTSVQHAQDTKKGRSIPKIVFGKYFIKGEKLLMPLSVEVHHALADGYHVGLFYKQFQKEINLLK